MTPPVTAVGERHKTRSSRKSPNLSSHKRQCFVIPACRRSSAFTMPAFIFLTPRCGLFTQIVELISWELFSVKSLPDADKSGSLGLILLRLIILVYGICVFHGRFARQIVLLCDQSFSPTLYCVLCHPFSRHHQSLRYFMPPFSTQCHVINLPTCLFIASFLHFTETTFLVQADGAYQGWVQLHKIISITFNF